MEKDSDNLTADDYRDSHLAKGETYDDTILSTPFDAYMEHWEGVHLQELIPKLYTGKIPRYLDFACGTGRITQKIATLADEAYGVDISQSMLNVAQTKCPDVRFICADLTRSDAQLGEFDLISSFRFFGNAQPDLRSAVLTTINTLLRDGGYLVINNHRNPRSLAALATALAGAEHELDLSHSKLKKLLKQHGFEIIAKRAIGFWKFRAKLLNRSTTQSRLDRLFEGFFRFSLFAPLAPDTILVARKIAPAPA